MRMRNWITLAAMAAAIAITAFAADVSGKWTAQMPGRDGQTREVSYNFKADGDKLTGTMSFPQGEMEIKEGKISGDNISFKVPVEFGGNAFVLIFKGTLSGDMIKFTRSREGADQTQEFTAKRAS
jgi:hypothetical protein